MTTYKGFRDAIHVPFVMVDCSADLSPGQKCSLRDDWTCVPWQEGDEIDWHGIADPFRIGVIKAKEVFPLSIRKECFSGLTHNFQIEVHDRGGTDTCHSVCDIF